jgi:nicotinate-nucleotide adenylyltransferase
MTPLALFGGTFDPVHVGHLRVAWEAAEALDAVVHMVPCHVPPHRDQPVASAPHRYEMLRRALAGQRRLVADDRELRRAGPSYTVDTLLDLRREHGDERPLVLLVGADAFAGLSSWHRWRELFQLAHLGVLTRPGHGGVFEAELAAEWFARRVDAAAALRAHPAGAILPIAVSALDVSASQVRAELAAGREPRYLVPDAVLGYLVEHGVYRG